MEVVVSECCVQVHVQVVVSECYVQVQVVVSECYVQVQVVQTHNMSEIGEMLN